MDIEKRKKYMKEYSKLYRLNHPELKIKKKEYCKLHKKEIYERIKPYAKKYYQNHKEKMLNYTKERRLIPEVRQKLNFYNRTVRKQYRLDWKKNKIKNDLHYKIKELYGYRINKALKEKRLKKPESFVKIVGCSLDELKTRFEKKFINGMNWENYGKVWQIDHITPSSHFDLKKIDDQKRCYHYTNLMPRFATTEIAKSFGCNQIGNLNKRNKKVEK